MSSVVTNLYICNVGVTAVMKPGKQKILQVEKGGDYVTAMLKEQYNQK